MLHKRQSLNGRGSSLPQPTCMTSDQQGRCSFCQVTMSPLRPRPASHCLHFVTAAYLSNLRNNRPSRPTGSRPLPSRPSSLTQYDAPIPRAASTLDLRNSHGRASPSLADCGAGAYQESHRRTAEMNEAHDLRTRLAKLDQVDEERLYSAAKSEAADLVWQHQNPKQADAEKAAPYVNPDLNKYGSLTSIRRTAGKSEGGTHLQSRSSSNGSDKSEKVRKPRLPWLTRKPKASMKSGDDCDLRPDSDSAPRSVTFRKASRDFNAKRTISRGSSRGVFSNPEDEIYEEVGGNPPETATAEIQLPLQEQRGNMLLRGARPLPEKLRAVPQSDSDKPLPWKPVHVQSEDASPVILQVESDNAVPDDEEHNSESHLGGIEIRSEEIRAATSMRRSDRSSKLPTPTAVSDRPGRPIVSFDPAWKPITDPTEDDKDEKLPGRHDRSMAYPVAPVPDVPQITIMEEFGGTQDQAKPQPSVRDSFMSRPASISTPIISIEGSCGAAADPKPPPLPRIQLLANEPSIPAICTDAPPTINIDFSEPDSRPLPLPAVKRHGTKPRPLPEASNAQRNGRPLPSHASCSPSQITAARSSGVPVQQRVPWLDRTPTLGSRSTVVCAACKLSISGRIVTASGSSTASQKARFHPECFTCQHCATSLECISFYPEPRTARLERLQTNLPHLSSDDPQLLDVVDSNDDLHFFCHLDFHEFFSPRCHTCKTPIEGQVVLALGRHYHPDHFFCAECGDPFTSDSPFIEHNHYAYCVRCHTKRTSARCKACKNPILDEMTIEALGGKWHDRCFVCFECAGDFGELGRFFVREVEVELTEKERRRGMTRKVEERAACQGCEERRVKNTGVFV